MNGELIEMFCDEIRDAIFDIGKKLLKTETENFQVLIEPLFTEGEFFQEFFFYSAILNIEFYHHNIIINRYLLIFCSLDENLISTVYRVRFNATDGDQKTSLFLKVAPNNELKRSLLQINNTFVREAYAYGVVRILYSL